MQSETLGTQSEMSTGEPSSSGVGQRRKRTVFRPIETPPLVETAQSSAIKSIADAAMQMMCRSDEFSAFTDHICAELRRLPNDAAQLLKLRLTRTMLDFLEERMVNLKAMNYRFKCIYNYFSIRFDWFRSCRRNLLLRHHRWLLLFNLWTNKAAH